MTTAGESYCVAPNVNDAPGSSALPIGAITMWATGTAPSGWALCDGSAVSRVVFASLFSVIGTLYGAGNGTTTFNLPNFAGRLARGVNGTYPLASTGGADTQSMSGSTTITASNLPPHRHAQVRGGGINIISSGSTAVQGTSDNTSSDGLTQANGTYLENGTTLVSNTPLPLAVTGPVVNPYLAINYIIKAF